MNVDEAGDSLEMLDQKDHAVIMKSPDSKEYYGYEELPQTPENLTYECI